VWQHEVTSFKLDTWHVLHQFVEHRTIARLIIGRTFGPDILVLSPAVSQISSNDESFCKLDMGFAW
jgi:hypothetical protein